jgi:hypothetical protein
MTQSPVPIFEALIHPPLGLVKRELIPGLFSGSYDLTRATGALAPFNNVNAYGLTWSIFSVAAPEGIYFGFPNIYEHRLIQVATVHRDYSGHDFISEYHDFQVEGLYWLWENPGPQLVHVEIPSNVQLNLWWIVVNIP